jgi:hypothetical protein
MAKPDNPQGDPVKIVCYPFSLYYMSKDRNGIWQMMRLNADTEYIKQAHGRFMTLDTKRGRRYLAKRGTH